MTINDVIREHGGNAAFSRARKIPLKTVEGWKSGKHIAQYHVESHHKAWLWDKHNIGVSLAGADLN